MGPDNQDTPKEKKKSKRSRREAVVEPTAEGVSPQPAALDSTPEPGTSPTSEPDLTESQSQEPRVETPAEREAASEATQGGDVGVADVAAAEEEAVEGESTADQSQETTSEEAQGDATSESPSETPAIAEGEDGQPVGELEPWEEEAPVRRDADGNIIEDPAVEAERAAEESAEESAGEGEEPVMPEGVNNDQIVEAVLFSSDSPLPASKIASVVGALSSKEIRAIVERLNENYRQWNCSFCIQEIAGGFQMLTRPEYATYLHQLYKIRSESKLSPASLETLAIVAYKQPVLRAEIEAIRGVACGEMIRTLMEKDLIKIVGRAEELGRPMLYGTTKRFMQVFGLASLEDLPKVPELLPPSRKPTEAAKPAEEGEKKAETATLVEAEAASPAEKPAPEESPVAEAVETPAAEVPAVETQTSDEPDTAES